MRARSFALAAVCATVFGQLPAQAGPTLVVGAAGYVTAGYYGGARWVGGPYYRPWPGYGWRYGYPAYGYGLGWGAAWAVWPRWNWGAAYIGPSFYPYAVVAPAYPTLPWSEEMTYVQPPLAAPAQPAPQPPAYWYYCTEPAGYHPYVAQCRRPWIAVQPVVPAPAEAPQ